MHPHPRRSIATGLALTTTLAVVAATMPAHMAEAHCAEPGYLGPVLYLLKVSTCHLNEPLEEVVDAVNEAHGGRLSLVLVKDKGFHPPVVRVASGGSVVLAWADVEGSEQHDPRNTNRCRGDVDPERDPLACRPTGAPGTCFDVLRDAGGMLSGPGDLYALTFWYAPDTATLQVAPGVAAGLLPPGSGLPHPLPEDPRTCPEEAAHHHADRAVVPYASRLHGHLGRAAIVVEA